MCVCVCCGHPIFIFWLGGSSKAGQMKERPGVTDYHTAQIVAAPIESQVHGFFIFLGGGVVRQSLPLSSIFVEDVELSVRGARIAPCDEVLYKCRR